ncbi:MAG: hypothetical protein ABI273_07310 [Lacunisphaera sp.]
MKKLTPLFLIAIFCGVSSLLCSCATHKTVGGESLSKRSSLRKDDAATISKMVEERLGRDVFWVGPYKADEAMRYGRIGATEAIQSALSAFAARHQNERFFICFDFVILDGFPKGHAKGYVPKIIFAVGDGGAIEWFDLEKPIKSGSRR